MGGVDISEKMATVEEQLKAVTPGFISLKFDESLRDPENIKTMQERRINVDDIIAQKPELVKSLHNDMQSLLASLPDMQKGDMGQTQQDRVNQAIEDFPQMFGGALNDELSKLMNHADKRVQKQFGKSSIKTDDASHFLENGELLAGRELDQKGATAVGDTVAKIMQVLSSNPDAVDAMRAELRKSGASGIMALTLLDKRLADQTADVGLPSKGLVVT